MPKFDGSDGTYTQNTVPARNDRTITKDVSETLPENQTKFAELDDLLQFGSWSSTVRVVTASGTVTLANTDPIFIEINPNGADRDVSLPAKADDNHAYIILHSGSANTLTIKMSGGTTVTTISAGQAKYIMPSTLKDFTVISAGSGSTGGGGGVYPCFVRASVVSGVFNPTADYSAQGSIYVMPCFGDTYAQYNGSTFSSQSFVQQTLTLNAAHTSGSLYDVYLWNDSGTQRVVTGPAWSSSTSRGTGAGTAEIEIVSGVTVNKVSMTVRNGANTYTMPARYGTVVATITMVANGQVDWNAGRRDIFNFYNQMPVPFYICPGYSDNNTNTSYVISATSWTEANGGTGSRIKYVLGEPSAVWFHAVCYPAPGASGVVYMSIGLDTITNPGALVTNQTAGVGEPFSLVEDNKGIPMNIGARYASLLFYIGTANCTVFADIGRRGGSSADNPATFLTGKLFI